MYSDFSIEVKDTNPPLTYSTLLKCMSVILVDTTWWVDCEVSRVPITAVLSYSFDAKEYDFDNQIEANKKLGDKHK